MHVIMMSMYGSSLVDVNLEYIDIQKVYFK